MLRQEGRPAQTEDLEGRGGSQGALNLFTVSRSGSCHGAVSQLAFPWLAF